MVFKKLVIIIFLMCIAGCASIQHASPIFEAQELELTNLDGDMLSYSNGTIYTFNNATPTADTHLVDGKYIDVSVFMRIQGSDNVEVHLETLAKKYKPYKFSTFGDPANVDINGIPTWQIKPRGKSEIVAFYLYSVEPINSGNTTNRVLIKKIQHYYRVYCNEDEFFLSLFFKTLFNYCTREPDL